MHKHSTRRSVQKARKPQVSRQLVLQRAVRPTLEKLENRQLLSVPNGPYALSTTATSTSQVALLWHDNSTDETGFRVERSAGDGNFKPVAYLAPRATTFADTGLSAAMTYLYRVCAYSAGGDSSFTNIGSISTGAAAGTASTSTASAPVVSTAITTTATSTPSIPVFTGSVPNGPYVLSATAASSQVNLLWHDNHSNELGYKVERRPASGGSYSVVATLNQYAITWADTGTLAGTQYVYRVKAYNNAGDSSYTNEATVTAPASAPSAPAPTPVAVPSVVSTPSSTTTQSTTAPATSPAGFFPTGVFYQPTSTFGTWASRGVNTVFGYDGFGGPTMAEWDAAAAANGLKTIRQPSANLSADASNANLIAWLTPTDEPDMSGASAGTLSQQYWQLKSASWSKPVVTTYSGGLMLGWLPGPTASQYQTYMQSTDWVAADIYPVTGWGQPNQLGAVGQVVDRAQQLAPAKRQLAFIETSNQQLPWVTNDQGATPDQVRGEIWDAVIHGASGIVYFSRVIGGPNGAGTLAGYDGTPADVAQELTAQDARLQQYGAALLSPANPTNIGMSVNGPLEVTWRSYAGHDYFYVLNLSNQWLNNQTLNVRGEAANGYASVDGEARSVSVNNGAISDNFKPYEMHVYVV